jgi:hypothetical protein
MGLTDSPICEKCAERDVSATHPLCDCESLAYLRFRHPGHYFIEPCDYQDAPALHSKCKVVELLMQNRSLKVVGQGPV